MTDFTPPPPLPPEPPRGPSSGAPGGPVGPGGPGGPGSVVPGGPGGPGGPGEPRASTRIKALLGGIGVLAVVLIVLVVVLIVQRNGAQSDQSATGAPTQPTQPNPTSSSGPGSSGSGSPSARPTGRGTVPAGLSTYYDQDLDWGTCPASSAGSGGSAGPTPQCAKLTVPIDYDQPGGATIGLKVERIQAEDPTKRVGSLVVNPGGPGAPGTTMLDTPSFFFGQPLLDQDDIVAFDPRGTGDSDPVRCLSDSQLDTFVAQDPQPQSPAQARSYARSQRQFFASCVKNSDSLIAHVSTVEAAKDMDVLRAALDEPQLDYLGFSYGTKLGATYADLFPRNVGRFVLDGAVDPELNFKQAAVVQAGGFQTALDSYVDNCISQGNCFLGATRATALDTISGLLATIEKQPLTTQLGRKLYAGNAFFGIITPLYSRDNWTYLDMGLKQALAGDGTTLLVLSDSYASRNTTSGGYTDNSLEANLAINCLDDPSSLRPGRVPSQYATFEKASPTFGRVFAWGLIGCDGIKVRAETPAPAIGAPGANPILVLGTTRDPATPFSEAKALASELDSGVLISRDGDGHTAYNKANSCIDDAVEGYLLKGTVPKSGLSC